MRFGTPHRSMGTKCVVARNNLNYNLQSKNMVFITNTVWRFYLVFFYCCHRRFMNLDVNELAKLVAHMNLIHRTNKRKRKKNETGKCRMATI